MARCTKEEALQTRDRILDAAEEVFFDQGVSRTSLSEIATAAGVTRGAIYWHFKNKDDLFDAMCERVRLPMEAMVAAGADRAAGDPLGQLRATCIFVLRETASNARARRVFGILFHRCEYVDGADMIWSRQQQSHRKGRANIEQILRNAAARGQLPEELNFPLAATVFHANWSGLLNNWLFAPDAFNLEQDAETFVDTWIETLRHAPSLRR